MAEYIVENYNPIIASKQADGKQEIGLHDYDTGNRRYITTDSTKIDEFVSKRKNAQKKATIIGAIATIATTAIGTIIGIKKAAYSDKIFNMTSHLKPVNTKSIGAFTGAMIGLSAGIFPSQMFYKSSDKKVTQAFINENK